LLLWCADLLRINTPTFLKQNLPRQTLPGSGEGEARTTAPLLLVPVLVVFIRWFKDLFIGFASFRAFYTAINGY
jgi:hypothetical protein